MALYTSNSLIVRLANGIMIHKLKIKPKTVGAKQTLKALNQDKVIVLYIAKDAQEQVTKSIIEIAEEKNIPIEYINTMIELGKACNVDVKTAAAALIKE